MIRLKVFMSIVVLIAIVYNGYRFMQFMIRMKQKIVLPTTKDEIAVIRNSPQKTVDFPTYSKQKMGIIMYLFILLSLIVMLILGVIRNIDWSLYILLIPPLINSYNLLNLFAVVDDGLLIGNSFVDWRKINSFQFIPIDINHKFYGYSKEVNGGFELKIRTKFFASSCIITSNEMKETLTVILNDHVMVNEEHLELK